MKKPVIIITIIVAVVLVVDIIMGAVFVKVLGKKKTAISASDFKSTMEDKDFYITDAKSQFSGADYIEHVYVAVSEDYGYQVEFYEMTDEDDAVSFFNDNKEIFEDSKGSGSSETSTSLKNYSKYTLSTNGKYKVVSRIDNTVIFLNVDDEYKDEVKDLLNELGY